MRIISDYHDFYDCIQKQGIDKECLYFRKETSQEVMLFPNFHLPWARDTRQEYVIGFCGQIYWCLEILGRSLPYSWSVCQSIDDIDTWVSQNYSKREIAQYLAKSKRRPSYSTFWRKELVKIIEEFSCLQYKYKDVFINQKCPIIVQKYINRDKAICTFNAKLKDLHFERIKDPFSSYQELYQYISGVLGNKNPDIPYVSDIDLRDAKGFDKWSFKKEPRKI